MNNPQLSAQDQKVLDALMQKVSNEADHFIGYPCNQDFDYSPLFPLLSYAINNVGDPFVSSNYHVNSHELEREVLADFARLTHAGDNYWGYVTNGGTEGNMYGLYLARELYPECVVYYSQDTHYSIAKVVKLLKIRNIMIRSLPNGEIDYEDLCETIRINRHLTPIVVANIGTTMKGAIDNVDRIHQVFQQLALPAHYVHCDAALSGMILPFVEDGPHFGFESGVDSIAISGHKFIGSPIPCGIALAQKQNVDRIARAIEYVGTLDTTLTGSRNGITPVFLWYALRIHGEDYFREVIQRCYRLADYAIEQLNTLGVTPGVIHSLLPWCLIIPRCSWCKNGSWPRIRILPILL